MTDQNTEPLHTTYARLVEACKQDDIPAVEQCILQLLKTMEVSAAKFAVLIGMSGQTVLRWTRHKTEQYAKAKPSQKSLEKIEEVIGDRTGTASFNLPRSTAWNPAHLRAVANTKNPCRTYWDMLIAVEHILGCTLDEKTSTLLLRKVEEQ